MNHLLIIFAITTTTLFAMGNRAPLEGRWSHLDPSEVVPGNLLEFAMNFYDENENLVDNKNYVTVIDFGDRSTNKRFYMVNLTSGEVNRYLTAHGSGSDRDHNGYAESFSNNHGSHQSSLGFYKTAETYYGKHGYSLRLDGLSRTNSNARSRAIVIHGASYVTPFRSPLGRSWGCPALEKGLSQGVIDRIKHGSLIYAGGVN